MSKVIFIVGDLHGSFAPFNTLINNQIRENRALRAVGEIGELEIIILQCGDLAFFWPGQNFRGWIKNEIGFVRGGRVPIYWCAGNHEDHDHIDALFPAGSEADRTGIAEVDKGVFFCRFGATLDISSEITVLFAGGAESIDRDYRIRKMASGYPKIWWEQEGISSTDLARLANVPKADWVLSHTAPMAFDLKKQLGQSWIEPRDPYFNLSRHALDKVWEKYHPKRWFFGHFHQTMHGRHGDCEWLCLNYPQSGQQWWEKLILTGE